MKTLSYGEVLWDLIDGKEHIGGAPFNMAAHLARLGCASYILSRVGRDRLGKGAILEMDRLKVNRKFAQVDAGRTTGWAKVTLDSKGVASFAFPANPAYDFISANRTTVTALAKHKFDAVCFGTLVQKGTVSRSTLLDVLKAVKAPHVFYDVNIRLDFYPIEILRSSLSFATIVKLNDDELPRISKRLYGRSLAGAAFAARLGREFPVRVVCVTRGARGCSVYAHGSAHHVAGKAVKVVDTVGAGDAFSAAFLRHYVCTGDVAEAARLGNLLGAYVASRAGAVPEYSSAIRKTLALT